VAHFSQPSVDTPHRSLSYLAIKILLLAGSAVCSGTVKFAYESPQCPGLTFHMYRAETVEEKDLRVRAEKRAKRTEQAAQVISLAILSLLLIASSLFLFLTYTGW
jgi:hypothetical protein